MVGVVLVSHGGMAEGVYSSASMLVPDLSQVAHLGLWPEDNPDEFQAKIEAKIKEVDTGDGVFVLADMLGGTPCNRAIYTIGEKVKLLCGLSLPMLYTLLSAREIHEDLGDLVTEVMEEAKDGIVFVNDLMQQN